ncbi:MAG: ATPase [Woeseiaceae bacterium]
MRRVLCLAALLLGAQPHNATAEVVDADKHGFTLVSEVVVDATRAEAWIAAVDDVAQWWNPDHTISGNAGLLTIDPRPLGCFCESTGDGVVHLIVTTASENVILRMTGGLGPLGLMGVNGNMTWEFFDDENGTLIRFTYAVGGYSPDGLDSIAGAVDYVVVEALNSLKAYINGS